MGYEVSRQAAEPAGSRAVCVCVYVPVPCSESDASSDSLCGWHICIAACISTVQLKVPHFSPSCANLINSNIKTGKFSVEILVLAVLHTQKDSKPQTKAASVRAGLMQPSVQMHFP